ncbi:MAG: thermonuclease family protein [Proteobacteria bacterium]|nr:thermonuclease family protein [Pseudomonadota bacterium]
MRCIYTKLIFILLLFLLSCNSSASTKKSSELTVINVYDGDTIELSNGEKLRYLGIDTPELHKKEGDEWIDIKEPYAKEAYEFNKTLVLGKTIKIIFDREKRDRYGRLLGYVFVDNIFVNEALLKEGLAFINILEPNDAYKERLKKAFIDAYFNNKNLFSKKIDHKNIYKYVGQIGWYEGKIRNIIIGEKRVEILTDHLIVESSKRTIKRINPSIGDYIYAYGQLERRKGRFLIKVKKSSHIFIEKN